MADLTPNNREEHWLQGMVDGETTLEPNKRREYWYKEIVDAIGSGGGGGTGGGVLVVGIDMDTMTLDKTWNEIASAPYAVLKVQDENIVYYNFIFATEANANNYRAIFATITLNGEVETMPFGTDSADGYPLIVQG